jgi:superfamily II DNA helicase RecQ
VTPDAAARLADACRRLDEAARDLLAAANELQPRKAPTKAQGPPDPPDPVFEALRKWRTERARAKAVPPYIIATDSVLRAIAQARPQDAAALQAIRGIGPAKASEYGPDLLRIVAEGGQEVSAA